MAIVQQAQVAAVTTGAVTTLNFSAAVTAGDAIVLTSWNYSNGNPVLSISGNGGNWVKGGSIDLSSQPAGAGTADLWYNLNPSATNGTITVTYTSTPTQGGITISETSPITALDTITIQNFTASATSYAWTPFTGPTQTPNYANEMFFDIYVCSTTTYQTNWTTLSGFSGQAMAAWGAYLQGSAETPQAITGETDGTGYIGLLMAGFYYNGTPTYQTIALVQQTYASTGTTTSASITLSNVVAGDQLILNVNTYNNGASISGVSGGGTWAKAVNTSSFGTSGVGLGTTDIWYCLSATGGSTTVSITFSSAPTNNGVMNLSEWSGIGGLDVTGTYNPTSTTASWSSPTVTSTYPGDLFIVSQSTSGYGSVSGVTALQPYSGTGYSYDAYVLGGSSPGNFTVTGSQGSAGGVQVSVAAFYPQIASTGGGSGGGGGGGNVNTIAHVQHQDTHWTTGSPTSNTITVTPSGVGDLAIVVADTYPSTPTGISGGGITWNSIPVSTGGGVSQIVYWGITTSATSQTYTVIFSAAATSGELSYDEFNYPGGSWSQVTANSVDNTTASTTINYPVLTSTASGQLYYGYTLAEYDCSAGSSTGYVYEITTHYNAIAYNLNVTKGSQAPTVPQSGSGSSVAVAIILSPFGASAGGASATQHVQNKTGSMTTGTTQTLAWTPTAVGNVVCVAMECGGTQTTVTISGGGVTWANSGSPATDYLNDSAGNSAALFWGVVNATGAQTVTITLSTSTSVGEIVLDEFNYPSASWSVLNSGSAYNGASSTMNYPTLPATAANELYFGYGLGSAAASAGSSGGFSYLTTGFGAEVAYAVSTQATNFSPTAVLTSSGTSLASGVLFSASGSPSDIGPFVYMFGGA